MRMLERITVAMFTLVLLVFGFVTVRQRYFVDHTAPTLVCSTDQIEVSVNEPESALLWGVSASDDRDGDLTDQIIVKSVTPLITNNTAKVTYVVFDRANNMSTCSRTVKYVDYGKPVFSLSRPLIYRVGQAVTLKDRLTASDVVDGDISSRIRVTTQNVSAQYAGTYGVTVQVTNSLGDAASVPLKVIITDGSTDQRIMLDQYICYVAAGEDFDPVSHITLARNADYSAADPASVTIDSNVDPQIPGVYEVLYSHDGYSVYMTVIVE